MFITFEYIKRVYQNYDRENIVNGKIEIWEARNWFTDEIFCHQYELFDIQEDCIIFAQIDNIVYLSQNTNKPSIIVIYLLADEWFSDDGWECSCADPWDCRHNVQFETDYAHPRAALYRMTRKQYELLKEIYDTVSLVREEQDIHAAYYQWSDDMKMLVKLYCRLHL